MTKEIRQRIARSGEAHPLFKGEWIATYRDGTKRAFVHLTPEERQAFGLKRPYTLRYRYVWNVTHPDDPIKSGEIIHHIDHNPLNDHPDNLIKMRQSAHAKAHFAGVPKSAEHVAKQAASLRATLRRKRLT